MPEGERNNPKAHIELETLQVFEILKKTMALPLILDCAGNENITIEDAEQPEEGVGVGEGDKGRKRERGGTTDEGTNGGSNLFPNRFRYGGFTFS